MPTNINQLIGGGGWEWTWNTAGTFNNISAGPARVYGLHGYSDPSGCVSVQAYDGVTAVNKKLGWSGYDAIDEFDLVIWPAGVLFATAITMVVVALAGSNNAGMVIWRSES